MSRQDRLEEIMAEMLEKQDAMIDELKGANRRLERVESRLEKMEKGVDKMGKDMQKLNLQSTQNSRALMKLADLLEGEVVARISRLEDAVYKR